MRQSNLLPRFLRLIICTQVLWAGWSPPDCLAKNIYLIVVGDTSDEAQLGSDVKRDMVLMETVFKGHVPPEKLHVSKINGDQLSRQAVLTTIKRLRVTSDDSIVFYYSGHGKWDNAEQRHAMQFVKSRETMFREEVCEEIVRRRPRTAVVITDCCAAGLVAQGAPDKAVETFGPPPDRISPLFNRLFLDYSGVISVSSSEPGEVSLTRGDGSGSLFTYPFAKLLHARAAEPSSWNSIIEDTRTRVQADFARVTRGRPVMVDRDGDRVKETEQTTQTVCVFVNTPRLGMRAALRNGEMVVLEIMDLSPAARAGVKMADRLLEINGQRIQSEQEYSNAVDRSDRLMRMKLRGQQSGEPREVRIELNR